MWRRYFHRRATDAIVILGGSNPAEVRSIRVFANFLDAFAVRLALGRTFNAQEELPNGPKAVLLTNHPCRTKLAAEIPNAQKMVEGWT